MSRPPHRAMGDGPILGAQAASKYIRYQCDIRCTQTLSGTIYPGNTAIIEGNQVIVHYPLLQDGSKPISGLGCSVGRSRGSLTNVTLPLQFCLGPPFPTLLRPAGHPQNSLKFWSVGRSQGSHTNVTLPFQFRHQGPPFPTLLRPAGHPQNDLKFWSVGRSGGQSVTGKSHEPHAASLVSSPRLALPDPSTPCGPPPKWPENLVSRSVGQLVTGKSHKRHAACSRGVWRTPLRICCQSLRIRFSHI
jgi:hypothetical protein